MGTSVFSLRSLPRVEVLDGEEKMAKNSLCRGCAKSYPRKEGVEGRYCSDECKKQYPRLVKKCEPDCLVQNLVFRNVRFKDGTEHTQRSCQACRNVKYVPRIE